MILNTPLNYGGRLYNAGDNVKGKLPPDMLELLQEKGAFEAPTELTDQKLPNAEGGILSSSSLAIFGDEKEREVILPLTTGDNNDEGMSLSPTRSVAELEEYLKDVQDAEEVQQLLDHEQESAVPRSSAIKVLEKRLKELNEDV